MKNNLENNPIIISGAGPVGLTLACFLTHQGIPIRIIEQRSGPVSESRALGVHARTLELLRPLKLDQVFIENGRVTKTMNFHNAKDPLFNLSFGVLNEDTMYPYYLILPQAKTERILLQWLKNNNVEVEWNTTVCHVNETANTVHLKIKTASGIESIESPYIAACDGASSFIRTSVGIEFEGETYDSKFMLSEVRIKENKIPTDATHVYLAKKTVAAVIPMPGGEYRIVGPDSLFNNTNEASFNDFRSWLNRNGLFSDLTLYKPSRVKAYQMHKRISKSFMTNRIFLCGDAAHIHSPAGGQGMNTGMQDAINLSWKLALVLKEKSETSILHTYDIERRVASNAVVKNTDKAMSLVTSQNKLVKFAIHWIAPIILNKYTPKKLMQGMAQLTIDYSEPHKESTQLGSIRKGLRFPYFRISQSLSSMDLHNGRDWILIVNLPDESLTTKDKDELHKLIDSVKETCGGLLQAYILRPNKFYKKPIFNNIDWIEELPIEIDQSNNVSIAPHISLVRPDGYILETIEGKNTSVMCDKIEKKLLHFLGVQTND